MRLLHSKVLELFEFTEREIPPYAILSHTWETEEVSLQEMESNSSRWKKGYAKIRKCCDIAAAAGFQYVWVDTCCIDKTSSAELTEAINSMFLWYQEADVCLAYLADYDDGTSVGCPLPKFRESRWFRRGWTLQELIAPDSVIFFNSKWEDIGTKHSLREEISDITDIQIEALLGTKLEDFSVAQRMCWASRRETTRIEDEAYSLLGIFDVHMPMLYGEGNHAFVRLQEEIIKRSTDHTIFAWAHGFPATRSYTGGLLADCPSAFVSTKSIAQDISADSLPFEITNKGVHLHLPIYEESFGVLNCEDLKRPGYNLAISLTRKDSSDTFIFEYFRGAVIVPKEERKDIPVQSIYVLQGDSTKSLPARVPVASLEYYFECNFPRSGIFFEECYPNKWAQPPAPPPNQPALPWPRSGFTCVNRGTGIKLLPAGKAISIYGTIDFKDRAGNTFIVQLSTQEPVCSNSFRRNDTCRIGIRVRELSAGFYEDIFDEGHDRILWQHPLAKWWISIGMSRAIISGRRAMVVMIKDEPE